MLLPRPPDAVKAALKIDGPAKPTRVDVFPGAETTSVHVFFGAGPAGEQFTVRLAGARGEGGANVDMGYRLKRYPSPQITVELDKGEGAWGKPEPGATLPQRPLALRFTLPPGVNGKLVEQSVREAFAPGKEDTIITPVETAWDSANRLVLRLPEPPPRRPRRCSRRRPGHSPRCGGRSGSRRPVAGRSNYQHMRHPGI